MYNNIDKEVENTAVIDKSAQEGPDWAYSLVDTPCHAWSWVRRGYQGECWDNAWQIQVGLAVENEDIYQSTSKARDQRVQGKVQFQSRLHLAL